MQGATHNLPTAGARDGVDEVDSPGEPLVLGEFARDKVLQFLRCDGVGLADDKGAGILVLVAA